MSFERSKEAVLNKLKQLVAETPSAQYSLVLVNGQEPELYHSTSMAQFNERFLPPTTVHNYFQGSWIDSSSSQHAVEYPGKSTLNMDDKQQVESQLEQLLSETQQLFCKQIAKLWIRAVEPKKQTNYPYKRGDASKPQWWPRSVRHKEPDHLVKWERMKLMLAMLTDPSIDVTKLQRATRDVSHDDASLPSRAALLHEVYLIAKCYKQGGPPQLRVTDVASKLPKQDEEEWMRPAKRRKMSSSSSSSSNESDSSHKAHSNNNHKAGYSMDELNAYKMRRHSTIGTCNGKDNATTTANPRSASQETASALVQLQQPQRALSNPSDFSDPAGGGSPCTANGSFLMQTPTCQRQLPCQPPPNPSMATPPQAIEPKVGYLPSLSPLSDYAHWYSLGAPPPFQLGYHYMRSGTQPLPPPPPPPPPQQQQLLQSRPFQLPLPLSSQVPQRRP